MDNNAEFLLGTVTEISNANGIRIQIDGQDEAMTKYYKMMLTGADAPSVNDRVVVMKQSGTYIILGKIGTPNQADGKVSRSGDRMTGDLRIINKSVEHTIQSIRLSQHPASLVTQITTIFRDVAAKYFGRIMAVQRSDGRAGIDIGAVRSIEGSTVFNTAEMTIDDAGNKNVILSAPAAWLSALGPGIVTTSNASEIFSAITSGFTVSDAYYAQFGKVAMFSALFTPDHNRTSTAWLTWATLASGKRPARGITGACTATSYCVARASGEVEIALQYSSGYAYRVSATYLLP